MRQKSIILLLSLLLFPIIWNGITLLHHVVEHTHTFCATDTEHSHSNPDNCLSIFELVEGPHQGQLPAASKSEFEDLKQYLAPKLVIKPTLYISFHQINFIDSPLPEDLFLSQVFHPPIFA